MYSAGLKACQIHVYILVPLLSSPSLSLFNDWGEIVAKQYQPKMQNLRRQLSPKSQTNTLVLWNLIITVHSKHDSICLLAISFIFGSSKDLYFSDLLSDILKEADVSNSVLY